MTEIKKIGLTDSPANIDQFSIENYIEGLKDFILNCETPMTISIQGSWGSGKTSIMNMVKNRIEDNVIPVFFNTWQFSQFSLGNALPISMINVFIDKISGDTDEKKKNFFSKFKKNTISCLAIAGNAAAKALSHGWIDGPFSKDDFNKNSTPNEMNYANVIENLHSELQDAVAKACENENKDRVVVFIDDLDRLVPSKAMELLEVLKIFFDCQNCVFVLAIDYDVVIRGAAEKYGFNLNDHTPQGLKEAEKGKAFFDKIIQVPFKVPVVEYNISAYLEEGLHKININPDKEDLQKYQTLCSLSLGTNPRGLKRLLNAFLLLNKVRPIKSEKKEKSKHQLILFGLLCMQQFKENIYNLIVRVNREINGNAEKALELIALLNNRDSVYDLNLKYHTEISEEDIVSFGSFFEKFLEIIDIKPQHLNFMINSDQYSDEQMNLIDSYCENYMQLHDLLKLSATTATEESSSSKTFSLEDMKDNQKARYYFWNDLKNIALNDKKFIGSGMNFPSFKDDIWLPFASGFSKVMLSIRQARRDSKCYVTYWCKKEYYQELYKHKEKLNKELGLASDRLDWKDPNLSQKQIAVNYEIPNVPFDDPEKMKPVYDELIDVLVRFRDAIQSYKNI